jgi:hypothetical protein
MNVGPHFAKSDPEVQLTYRRILDAARALGPVAEEPKKTSIHLVARTAFAGVATRRSALILTLEVREGYSQSANRQARAGVGPSLACRDSVGEAL